MSRVIQSGQDPIAHASLGNALTTVIGIARFLSAEPSALRSRFDTFHRCSNCSSYSALTGRQAP